MLAGIRDRLLTPSLIANFSAELQKELDAAHKDADRSRATIEVQLVDTKARIAKLVQRIEEDEDAPRALVQRLKQLKEEEGRLTNALGEGPTPAVVRLPANYEQVYVAAVAELETHLTGVGGAAARKAIRALIDEIVVGAGEPAAAVVIRCSFKAACSGCSPC